MFLKEVFHKFLLIFSRDRFCIIHDSTLKKSFTFVLYFVSGTVPKKLSTVVISETVRETGAANTLTGE